MRVTRLERRRDAGREQRGLAHFEGERRGGRHAVAGHRWRPQRPPAAGAGGGSGRALLHCLRDRRGVLTARRGRPHRRGAPLVSAPVPCCDSARVLLRRALTPTCSIANGGADRWRKKCPRPARLPAAPAADGDRRDDPLRHSCGAVTTYEGARAGEPAFARGSGRHAPHSP